MNLFRSFKQGNGDFSGLETLRLKTEVTTEKDVISLIDFETNNRICELVSEIGYILFRTKLIVFETSIELFGDVYLIEIEPEPEPESCRLVVRMRDSNESKRTQAFFGVEYLPFDEYGPTSEVNDLTQVINPDSRLQVTPELVMQLLELIKIEITKNLPSEVVLETVTELPLELIKKDRKKVKRERKKRVIAIAPTTGGYTDKIQPIIRTPIYIPTDKDMGIQANILGETSFARILRITEARRKWIETHEQ
ncbi:MAG: hypothetical protein ACMG57_02085 [Candidatus Dojkabacteria bacterium]